MFLTLLPPLEPSVRQMANLLTVEHRPLFAMKNIKKMLNKFNLFEVDKSVSNIALKLEVDRKIKEVKSTFEFLIDQLKHQLLIVLIGYVLNHDSRLGNRSYFIPLNLKGLLVLNRQSLPHVFLLHRRLNCSQKSLLFS